MTVPSWSSIKENLDKALALAPKERAQFLTDLAEHHPPIYKEVIELLGYEGSQEAVLDQAMGSLFRGGGNEEGQPKIIGPYTIVRPIGQGGMGTVYHGVRHTDELEQGAAIKVLKHGMDTPSILRRFHAEREILRNLTHPRISGLLEGGTTADGRPYFAMELVEGQPITHYCDNLHVPIEQRLKLFMQVCEAVHFAHRNMVVHRDLKPSNILVTSEGDVKLLDFGIAKLLRPDGDQTLTALDMRPMTPAYASPEQHLGSPITTSSDIYSLGVLLFELLTGRRPLPDDAKPFGKPTRPSLVVKEDFTNATGDTTEADTIGKQRAMEPLQLSRFLKGDLDRIVLMALREEPERRYDSARQLAEDIHRALQGFPVLARGDSMVYVLEKWVARHKLPLFAVAITTLAIIGATWSTISSLRVVKEEKHRAAQALTQSQQFSVFSQEIMTALDPFQSDVSPDAWLDTIGNRLAMLNDQSTMKVGMLHTLGQVYLNRGELEKARQLLEQGRSIAEEYLGQDHPIMVDISLSLADYHFVRSELAPAQRGYQEAHERSLMRLGPNDLRTAKALHGLGRTARLLRQFEEATAYQKEALQIFSALDEQPLAHADCLEEIAEIFLVQYQLQDAEGFIQKSLSLRTQHLGKAHPKIANNHRQMASFYGAQRLYEQGEPYLQKAYVLMDRSLGSKHPEVARLTFELGILYLDTWDPQKGRGLMEQALRSQEKLLGPDHPGLIPTLYFLTRAYMDSGLVEQAVPHVERALALRDRAASMKHLFTPHQIDLWHLVLSNPYGRVMVELKRYDEAECALRDGLVLRDRMYGEVSLNSLFTLNALAHVYIESKQVAKADEVLARCHFIREALDQPPQLWDARTLFLSAINALRQDKYTEAETNMEACLDIYNALTEQESYFRALSHYWKGLYYGEKGDRDLLANAIKELAPFSDSTSISEDERKKVKDHLQALRTISFQTESVEYKH